MKIWIIVKDYGCEGYGAPVEAYTSEAPAIAAHGRLGIINHELFECELDPAPATTDK